MKSPILKHRKFGKWRVVGKRFRRQSYWRVLCQCECGTRRSVRESALIEKTSLSCGCRRTKHGHGGRRHSSEYHSHHMMLTRCYNKNRKDYRYYGARGIRVCKRWRKFENFLADMGRRPKGKTLDRKNNNGHYTPSNCRWATSKQQNNNRRKRQWLKTQ